MRAVGSRHPEVNRMMPFETVRSNFVSAARQGLGAHLTWLDGADHTAGGLLLDVLLPMASEGLEAAGVSDDDRTRYLDVIERRVRSGYTGSRWLLGSLNGMRNQGTAGQRLNTLTAAMVARQRVGSPVAEWTPATLDEGGEWRHNFMTIEQLMTTDLVTVAEDDPVELAANLMDWHRIRQVLVEDTDHCIVGLLSYRRILRMLARGQGQQLAETTVGDIMKRDPVSVPPDLAPLRALELMRSFGIGALPVVVEGQLVGIVTEHDFFNVAGMLLLEQLDQSQPTDDL
jgi:CBS domain-containing protein